MRAGLTALALLAAAAPLPAQGSGGSGHPQNLSVRAVERTVPVVLDGKLDEAVWASPAPATGFTQQDPREGEPASERTEVRFVHDADALYIGARMFDSLGAAGVRPAGPPRPGSSRATGSRSSSTPTTTHGRTIL